MIKFFPLALFILGTATFGLEAYACDKSHPLKAEHQQCGHCEGGSKSCPHKAGDSKQCPHQGEHDKQCPLKDCSGKHGDHKHHQGKK